MNNLTTGMKLDEIKGLLDSLETDVRRLRLCEDISDIDNTLDKLKIFKKKIKYIKGKVKELEKPDQEDGLY